MTLPIALLAACGGEGDDDAVASAPSTPAASPVPATSAPTSPLPTSETTEGTVATSVATVSDAEFDSIGRKPAGLDSRTVMVRYRDGISVVFNVNTGALTDPAELGALVEELHDIAVAAS